MPKQTKIRSMRSRAQAAQPEPEEPIEYWCTRCGKRYYHQYNNFLPSQSPLFRGNNGFVPVCANCLEDLYDHYRIIFGNDKDAVRRMCMKFDFYWHEDIYNIADASNPKQSRWRSYVSKCNLKRFYGKTYDDTIDEEGFYVGTQKVEVVHRDEEGQKVTDYVSQPVELSEPSPQSVAFWGAGLPAEKYFVLDERYRKWTSGLSEPPDLLNEARYKQICMLEENINSCAMSGKPFEASVNMLNNLIKDIQKSQTDDTDEAFDDQPFGVGIRMYENKNPIPKPVPELEDVDGIKRYITIWFVGHLASMLGLKNSYSRLYEEELAKYRVDRPDLEEEDDEGLLYEIFKDNSSE